MQQDQDAREFEDIELADAETDAIVGGKTFGWGGPTGPTRGVVNAHMTSSSDPGQKDPVATNPGGTLPGRNSPPA